MATIMHAGMSEGRAHDFLEILRTVNALRCKTEMQVRHGALLCLGEILIACKRQDLQIAPERLCAAAEVPGRVLEAKLLRGKGGELIRTALCRYVVALILLQRK